MVTLYTILVRSVIFVSLKVSMNTLTDQSIRCLMFSVQIHSYNKHARQNLISWKIADGTLYTDDLPGGIWKTGATLDVNMSSYLYYFS